MLAANLKNTPPTTQPRETSTKSETPRYSSFLAKDAQKENTSLFQASTLSHDTPLKTNIRYSIPFKEKPKEENPFSTSNNSLVSPNNHLNNGVMASAPQQAQVSYQTASTPDITPANHETTPIEPALATPDRPAMKKIIEQLINLISKHHLEKKPSYIRRYSEEEYKSLRLQLAGLVLGLVKMSQPMRISKVSREKFEAPCNFQVYSDKEFAHLLGSLHLPESLPLAPGIYGIYPDKNKPTHKWVGPNKPDTFYQVYQENTTPQKISLAKGIKAKNFMNNQGFDWQQLNIFFGDLQLPPNGLHILESTHGTIYYVIRSDGVVQKYNSLKEEHRESVNSLAGQAIPPDELRQKYQLPFPTSFELAKAELYFRFKIKPGSRKEQMYTQFLDEFKEALNSWSKNNNINFSSLTTEERNTLITELSDAKYKFNVKKIYEVLQNKINKANETEINFAKIEGMIIIYSAYLHKLVKFKLKTYFPDSFLEHFPTAKEIDYEIQSLVRAAKKKDEVEYKPKKEMWELLDSLFNRQQIRNHLDTKYDKEKEEKGEAVVFLNANIASLFTELSNKLHPAKPEEIFDF